MNNPINEMIFKLLTNVGFEYVADPYELNVNHRGDNYSLLLYQAKKFTEENKITIREENKDDETHYILRKDNKKICYFYTRTDYFVRCGDMKYACKIFVSDLMFY